MGFQTDRAESTARIVHRRAQRLMRRGETRKALQLMREGTARDPSGAAYCWLAHAQLEAGKRQEALESLRQALYLFRHDSQRGRARTVARWILTIDPCDRTALRKVA